MRSLLKASRSHAGGFVLSAVSAVIGCAHLTVHSLTADGLERQEAYSEPQSATTRTAADAINAEPQLVESSSLPGTIVTPHMEQAIVPGKNVLYCSTLQLAWNALEDRVFKEKIRLEGDPPVVRALGKRLSREEDLAEESYLAMVDMLTSEFLARLNDALRAKFRDQAPAEVRHEIPRSPPPHFLAYAYLFKNLEFARPFDLGPDPGVFSWDAGETAAVVTFGIDGYDSDTNRERGAQIKILEYRHDDRFILELKSQSTRDQIILAKMPPKPTLLETIEAMDRAAARHSAAEACLGEYEIVSIPGVSFNVRHTFAELSDKRIANEGKQDWRISEAMQQTRFTLNQKGAVLQSVAEIITVGSNTPPHEKPRHFVFDGPFLICLRQKDAKYPYLALWVGNAELLVKQR